MSTLPPFLRTLALVLGLALPLPVLVGCEPDTPAEEVGEAVEDVLDGRDTPAENAAEAVEDAADDVGRQVERATDTDMN